MSCDRKSAMNAGCDTFECPTVWTTSRSSLSMDSDDVRSLSVRPAECLSGGGFIATRIGGGDYAVKAWRAALAVRCADSGWTRPHSAEPELALGPRPRRRGFPVWRGSTRLTHAAMTGDPSKAARVLDSGSRKLTILR